MKTTVKKLILLSCLTLFSACTTIKINPDENLQHNDQTIVVLTDKEHIKSQGFVLRDRKVYLQENNQQVVIPVDDVHKITAINRRDFAKSAAKAGAAAGAIAGAYEIATAGAFMQGYAILAFPVIVVGLGAYAGAAAYLIGNRTYYELNPLDVSRQTAYSISLRQTSENKNSPPTQWGGYHLGFTMGPGIAYFKKINDFSTPLAQNRKTELFSGRLSFGKWTTPETIWGANISLSDSIDSNISHSANRGVFALGPQLIYFPSRYGLFYRGAVNFTNYYETVEDVTTLDSSGMGKIIYEKSYIGLGLSGSIGYAIPIFKRINISAELSGDAYFIDSKNTIGSASVMFGLHWF
ncbi:MAG TPA: hypothetical protein ENJ28_11910 [Gammaproteobacteria bacterium]|nr:hypothetical protein [Gammaproteobacteria bacterium]